MTICTITHPTGQANFSKVTFGALTVWFSYETPIAFEVDGARTVRENVWGPTTGKHLNYVSTNVDARLSTAEFLPALDTALAMIHSEEES